VAISIRMRGRVFAALRMFSSGSLPAGAALGGVLAGAFGLRLPALIGGAAIVVTGVVIAPVLRTSVIRQASGLATAAAESA